MNAGKLGRVALMATAALLVGLLVAVPAAQQRALRSAFGLEDGPASLDELQLHGMGPWTINYLNPADDPRRKD